MSFPGQIRGARHRRGAAQAGGDGERGERRGATTARRVQPPGKLQVPSLPQQVPRLENGEINTAFLVSQFYLI